jgi:hypothetical protein
MHTERACDAGQLEADLLKALSALPVGMKLIARGNSRPRRDQYTTFYRDALIFFLYQRHGQYGFLSILGRLLGRRHMAIWAAVRRVSERMKTDRATGYYDAMQRMQNAVEGRQ